MRRDGVRGRSRTADYVPPCRDRYTYIGFDECPDENRANAGKLLDEL